MYCDTDSIRILSCDGLMSKDFSPEEWEMICEDMRRGLHEEVDLIIDYVQGITNEGEYMRASKALLNSFYGWSATSLDMIRIVDKLLGKCGYDEERG